MNLQSENYRLLQLARELNQPTKYIKLNEDGSYLSLINELKTNKPLSELVKLKDDFVLSQEELVYLYLLVNDDMDINDPQFREFIVADPDIEPYLNRINLNTDDNFDLIQQQDNVINFAEFNDTIDQIGGVDVLVPYFVNNFSIM